MENLDLNQIDPQILRAIDNIFILFGKTRKPLKVEKVGEYAVTNPGSKDIMTAVEKLDRKHRTVEEAQLNLPTAVVLDNHLTGNEAEAFDAISDWARCSIIVPNFKSAPAVLGTIIGEIGGEISIHDHDDYKSFHVHSSIKDINVEVQIHTAATATLKQGTDIFYHKYRDVNIPKNSKIEQDYLNEHAAMVQTCNEVYQSTDFAEAKPLVEDLAKAYQQATNGGIPDKQKLSHFLEIIKKSEMVQNELFKTMKNALQNLTQIQDQTVIKEK